MPRLLLAVVVPTFALIAAGCSDASAPVSPDPSTLGGASFTRPSAGPVVNGIIADGEYDSGASVTFPVSLPTGGTATATVSFTHDRTDLYMAISFDRGSAFHRNDIVGIEFDNDNDGIRENGDDIVLSGWLPELNRAYDGGDWYRFNNGNDNGPDDFDGGTQEVTQAWGVVGTRGTFEMRHDLDSDDDAHDFSIDPMRSAQTVGFIVQVSLEYDPAGVNTYLHSFKPSSATYCRLTIGKKTTAISCPA